MLFPLGMGVNRLLKKTGDIPRDWRNRLDTLLGTPDWYGEFYGTRSQPTLFGEAEDTVVKRSTDVIGSYFKKRLKSVFAGVSQHPRVLRNSRNAPLYLLCFAAANEKGARIAVPIADHLLDRGAT